VLAGVLAMAASLTALATVIWSDFAEAAQQQVVLSDELEPPTPVKLAKIQHAQEQEFMPVLFEDEFKPMPTKPGKPTKRRLNFGSFEGY
jgi:hypothetical protein